MPRPYQIPDGLRNGTHTIANTATEIFPFSNDRVDSVLYNNGANTIFIGDANVTIANGLPLVVGGAITVFGSAAVYGIVAAATENLRALETYDA